MRCIVSVPRLLTSPPGCWVKIGGFLTCFSFLLFATIKDYSRWPSVPECSYLRRAMLFARMFSILEALHRLSEVWGWIFTD